MPNPNITIDADGKITFDSQQGFRVRVNIAELGTGCIERIHPTEPLYNRSSAASMSDLLLLRTVTIVSCEAGA